MGNQTVSGGSAPANSVDMYLMMSIRAFSMSLVFAFVPIYLFSLGFSLQRVILFYFVISATHASLSPVSGWLASKIGVRHGMLLGFLGYFVYYVGVYSIAPDAFLFLCLAIAYGAAEALFWVPFHGTFSAMTHDGRRGSEVARLEILVTISALVGPFVGGLIILWFGYRMLFVVALFILMVAALAVIPTKDRSIQFSLSFRANGFDRRVALSLGSFGQALNEVVWPIVAFALLGSAVMVGGIITLSVFFSVITIWVVGRLCDAGHRKKLLRVGSVGQAAVSAMRGVAGASFQAVGLEAGWRITSRLRDVSFSAAYYDRAARAENPLQFAMLREICIHLSIAFALGLVWVMAQNDASLQTIFAIASLGCLLGILIDR